MARRRSGFANDLITGAPIGLSVALWPAFMLAMDIIDRRTMWRDYWIEWVLAALFIAPSPSSPNGGSPAWCGAPVPLRQRRAGDRWSGSLCFPVAAFLVARLDRWRLGR